MQSRFIWIRWLLAAALLWVSFLPQFPVQAQSEPPEGDLEAEAVFYPDPGAYFKVGSTAYAVTAADCDPLTAGAQVCNNPLQAAVDFLAAQNLTPAGGKIILGAGVYNLGGATNPGPNWNIDGAVWTAYPPKLTLVGMGSALGEATTTLLQGYVSLSNLGSLTMSNMAIQSGSIGSFRVFTYGADLKAKAGTHNHPPNHRDQQNANIRQQVLCKDRSKNRNVSKQRNLGEGIDGWLNLGFPEDQAK